MRARYCERRHSIPCALTFTVVEPVVSTGQSHPTTRGLPVSQRSVISLYTGAGGLDLGLEVAGFKTMVAVEQDEDSFKTVVENRDWNPILADIHEVETGAILERGGLEIGEADLLVGGPPCQPFSKSAFWVKGDTPRLSDPRSSTLEQFLRVLREARPRAFLLENVPGLGYRGKDEGVELLRSVLEAINTDSNGELNYVGHAAVLDAASFGVPQHRRRFFMVGHREGTDFDFPEGDYARRPSEESGYKPHANGSEDSEKRLPFVTAWDAIGDLQDDDDEGLRMGGKWAGLLPTIPEGQNYLFHTPRGAGESLFGWRTRYWSFLLKLAKSRPSWTITAQPGSATGPLHWKNRRLSVSEMARLQTFPDDYIFSGKVGSARRQIGNAVPRLLAARLGVEVRRQLFLDDVADAEGRLSEIMPMRRTPVPDPEPLRPVPPEYLKLRAHHADHPGPGQGPGALAR